MCKDHSLQSAVLGSAEHELKLHECTLLKKKAAGNVPSRASDLGCTIRRVRWRTTSEYLPSPLSLSTHKKRRSWVSQVTHQIVLWQEQIHRAHQCQMSSVHIQQSLHCDWWKSHKVVVADVHVLDQHLTCLQHLFLAGHSLWIPLDHQTVQFRNVCRRVQRRSSSVFTSAFQSCTQTLALLIGKSYFYRRGHIRIAVTLETSC